MQAERTRLSIEYGFCWIRLFIFVSPRYDLNDDVAVIMIGYFWRNLNSEMLIGNITQSIVMVSKNLNSG